MITLKYFLPYQPSWFILTCLISTLGFSGCAEMSTMMGESNTLESEQHVGEHIEAPAPPPTIEEVEEAIASTKGLLDDQQKQIGDVLSLRGEVKQTLREFRDQYLAPMNATIETLQQQVGGWENTSTTYQATLSATVETLTQDIEQSKKRVGVYGEQVTALVDQIDQNNRQYEKLLTQFQDSLVEFKGTMGEFTVSLAEEKDRAIQEEGRLTDQLNTQQHTLERVMPTAKEILDIQKRLNQLHGYINQVRDTVTSDTATLQTTLKNAAPDNLQHLLTSLEQRLQPNQAPSTNPVLTEHLETLEQRVEESEKHYAEKVDAINKDIQKISLGMRDNKTQDIEQLHTLVTSLEQRYRHLEQTDSSPPTQDENLRALEQRMEQSEKQYAERVNALNEDIQKISVEMNNDDKAQETQNLHALVTSLEQRFQQLPQTSSSNSSLNTDLQALKQRLEQSEQQSAEVVKNIQEDMQKISATKQADDTTQEMENLQAAVISLEQRYQQLGQDSSSNPALTEQLHALEQRVEESEKHYAETVQGLHGDMKELSVGVQSGLNTPETEKLQALVASLEQRYQQLAHDPSSNPALTKDLKALEQRLQESEIQSAITIKALQHDLQKVSSRMSTLTQSIGAETVEALHRDIQAVSAGMLKLAQSISHLEQTKIQTKPIQAGSITTPRDRP